MIEISGALGALSATVGALKVALAARDEAKIDAAISDLKERLFDLQAANLHVVEELHASQTKLHALIGERDQLKSKLRERGLYALANLAKPPSEFWAYRYQGDEGAADGSTASVHYLCQACFDNDRKTVLRRDESQFGSYYACTVCKTDFHI
ncbi:MAG: hypothetical protein JSR41_09920 [Proteobacteria bacterium]|nr:hypothetical protein [Pseudomonadota bacterium]